MNLLKSVTLCSIVLMLSACAVVSLTVEGEKTRVLSAEEVTKCTYKGKTTSTTTDKLVGAKRHDKAVTEELLMLARNSAVNLGGDTVVADSEIKDGQQTFKVYRCVPQ
ncbi:MAG: DUF4156 domain-containing protein [Gammaproteobacteria bacterium]|nr:DUF4156 domain-containing protein [Gammaproteobacteria bacterium]